MVTSTNWIYIGEMIIIKVVCKSYTVSHTFKSTCEPIWDVNIWRIFFRSATNYDNMLVEAVIWLF